MRRLETEHFIIYYPTGRRAEVERFLAHADHCVDILRDSALVHDRRVGREDDHRDAGRRVQQRVRVARARRLRAGVGDPAALDARLHDAVRPAARSRVHRVSRAHPLRSPATNQRVLELGEQAVRPPLHAARRIRLVVPRGSRDALRDRAATRRRPPDLADRSPACSRRRTRASTSTAATCRRTAGSRRSGTTTSSARCSCGS